MVVFEIEDNEGNTLLGIFIEGDNIKTLKLTDGFSIADTDYDYLFDSNHALIRIQKDTKK